MNKKEKKKLEENINVWKEILIEDEQYDYAFLEKMILHKVKLMREYYLSGQSPLHPERIRRIVEEMTIVIEALDRLLDDSYLQLDKDLEIEWNEVENTEGVKEYQLNYITDYKPEELRKFYQITEEEKKRDRRLVYNTLRDQAPSWWD